MQVQLQALQAAIGEADLRVARVEDYDDVLVVPSSPPLASSFITMRPGVWLCPVLRKVRFCWISLNVGMRKSSEL